MQDPTYPLVPVASTIAAFLVILTMITSGARGSFNRGVVMFEGWVLVGLLITAIQTIVWRDSYNLIAPVFCDISSHLGIGLNVGIPACSFIITRRLWLIVNGDSPLDQSKLRREVFIDYFLGLGFPVLSMVLYYIVQGVRFQVVEDYGCASGVYQSGVAIILLDIWPLLLPFASASLYCWRVILYLYRHRRTVNGVLRGRAGMDRARYVRVLAIGCVDIILSLPVGVISFVLAVGVGPDFPFWPGWSVIHTNWDPLATPAQVWQADPSFRFRIYWNEWVNVIFAVAIFVLFGLTADSRRLYGRALGRAKDSVVVVKEWTSGVITSTLVPQSAFEIRPQPRNSRQLFTEKLPRHEEVDLLQGLNSFESAPGGLITIDIEVGAEIYRPGGVSPPLYTSYKPRSSSLQFDMV